MKAPKEVAIQGLAIWTLPSAPGAVFRSLAFKKNAAYCVCIVKPTKALRGRGGRFEACPFALPGIQTPKGNESGSLILRWGLGAQVQLCECSVFCLLGVEVSQLREELEAVRAKDGISN